MKMRYGIMVLAVMLAAPMAHAEMKSTEVRTWHDTTFKNLLQSGQFSQAEKELNDVKAKAPSLKKFIETYYEPELKAAKDAAKTSAGAGSKPKAASSVPAKVLRAPATTPGSRVAVSVTATSAGAAASLSARVQAPRVVPQAVARPAMPPAPTSSRAEAIEAAMASEAIMLPAPSEEPDYDKEIADISEQARDAGMDKEDILAFAKSARDALAAKDMDLYRTLGASFDDELRKKEQSAEAQEQEEEEEPSVSADSRAREQKYALASRAGQSSAASTPEVSDPAMLKSRIKDAIKGFDDQIAQTTTKEMLESAGDDVNQLKRILEFVRGQVKEQNGKKFAWQNSSKALYQGKNANALELLRKAKAKGLEASQIARFETDIKTYEREATTAIQDVNYRNFSTIVTRINNIIDGLNGIIRKREVARTRSATEAVQSSRQQQLPSSTSRTALSASYAPSQAWGSATSSAAPASARPMRQSVRSVTGAAAQAVVPAQQRSEPQTLAALAAQRPYNPLVSQSLLLSGAELGAGQQRVGSLFTTRPYSYPIAGYSDQTSPQLLLRSGTRALLQPHQGISEAAEAGSQKQARVEAQTEELENIKGRIADLNNQVGQKYLDELNTGTVRQKLFAQIGEANRQDRFNKVEALYNEILKKLQSEEDVSADLAKFKEFEKEFQKDLGQQPSKTESVGAGAAVPVRALASSRLSVEDVVSDELTFNNKIKELKAGTIKTTEGKMATVRELIEYNMSILLGRQMNFEEAVKNLAYILNPAVYQGWVMMNQSSLKQASEKAKEIQRFKDLDLTKPPFNEFVQKLAALVN